MIFQTAIQRLEFKQTFGIRNSTLILPNNIGTTWMEEINSPFRPPKALASLRVGFLGGESRRKGYPLLINTIELADKEKVSIRFVMGGNYTCPVQFKNVFNVGYVFDLKRFFRSIDVLVVPSEYDSFPNVFLEALAAGVPVIMSKNQITSEICGQNSSILFQPTYQKLFTKLIFLSKNVDAMTTIVRDCKALREKYSFCWVSEFEKLVFGSNTNKQ